MDKNIVFCKLILLIIVKRKKNSPCLFSVKYIYNIRNLATLNDLRFVSCQRFCITFNTEKSRPGDTIRLYCRFEAY